MSVRRTQFNVSLATGRYGLTGEIDITWEPRQTISGAPTVLLLHGMLSSCEYFFSYSATAPLRLMIGPVLASYGIKVIAIDGGIRSGANGPTNNALLHWGNPDHTARIETVRSSLGLSKISFVGLSMGNYAALQYKVNHPTRVDSIVSYSGCSDAVAFYNANGQPSYMADPWGVVSPAALPSAADIATHANLVGLPWLGLHNNDDTTVPVATAQAMATHIGSSARLQTYPTGDHEGIFANVDLEDVVSWIWDYSS